jgi:hypothetical protein
MGERSYIQEANSKQQTTKALAAEICAEAFTTDTLSEGKALSKAVSWMRSSGLSAADWDVITEYLDMFKPLKLATKQLEGRGKGGQYGAIYEVIPVYEYVLSYYEQRVIAYNDVDYNAATDAPKDHLAINLRAAWAKASDYDTKLDASPAYYAATILRPYYKPYCELAWADKPTWLDCRQQPHFSGALGAV